MTSLNEILAKSPSRPGARGELLTEHCEATLAAALEVRARLGKIPCLPAALRDRFWDLVGLAALAHDCGKLAPGFQDMVVGRTTSWGQRHELLSLAFLPSLVEDPHELMWVATGVLTHHRALTGAEDARRPPLKTMYSTYRVQQISDAFGPIDPQLYTQVAWWMARAARAVGLAVTAHHPPRKPAAEAFALFTAVIERWEDPVESDVGLAAVLLQGAVTMSDHLASAHARLESRLPLDSAYARRLRDRWQADGRAARPFQDAAAAAARHAIVRAPTGSGKTEAGLLWAAAQITALSHRRACAPRLFYTLPYLASINAMTDRLATELGEKDIVGVAHSRAASYFLARSTHTDDGENTGQRTKAASKAVARAAATRLFRERARVATPYQLLRGALAGPLYSSLLLDSANSVFVFDELHAYDPTRLGFILAGIGLWSRLGGSVAVLSATLPTPLIELLEAAVDERIPVCDGRGMGLPPRHRLNVDQRHLTDPATIDQLSAQLEAGHSVLVVANNVHDAQHLYEHLAPVAVTMHGQDGAHLLHARFRRGDRDRIEQAITKRYATDATPRVGGLLVATQTVEVSLNVDFDLLHTSCAPLEAILQRFGRVNRTATREPASVTVHQPTYTTRRGEPGQFADGVYLQAPVELAWQILCAHDGALIDEDEANQWLEEIYASAWGITWRGQVEQKMRDVTGKILDFSTPFADRSFLEEQFDQLFDGAEAILESDRDAYADALAQGRGSAGRLLADEYLIPLPFWARGGWDQDLRVNVINAEYDPHTGIGRFLKAEATRYVNGEVL